MSNYAQEMEGIPKQDLPKLPVPPLKQTVERFLKSSKPFLSESEYQVTEKLWLEFMAEGGIGQKLQQNLQERFEKTENWLAEWWARVVYLGSRAPLPLNQSVGSLHPLNQEGNDRFSQVAALLQGMLLFKERLYKGEVEVDKLGPHPQDMSQYYYILGSCRIPGQHEDHVRFMDVANHPRHAIVMHNNRLFSVPVYDKAGGMLNQTQLIQQFKKVVESSPTPSPAPVGILTSEKRDVWYQVYQTLSKDSKNRECFDQIESSIISISFDGPLSDLERTAPNRPSAGGHMVLTGCGGRGHACNRWFDKTLQILVSQDGEVGESFEHSASDGYCVSILADHGEAQRAKFMGPERDPVPPAGEFSPPHELQFNVPNELLPIIEQAKINADKASDNFEVHSLVFSAYGKEFIKAQHVRPDSYIQLAIQIAFQRLHGCPGAQYETATTRSFLYGRTETIRSCTPESVTLANTIFDPQVSKEDKFNAAIAAVTAHGYWCMHAVGGEGIDRHMLGLRLAARELGLKEPEVFSDPGFVRSSHMRIATSQIPAKCDGYLFFAPLVEDGYGICYNPQSNKVIVSISAYKSCTETSAEAFAKSLEQAFLDMRVELTNYAAKS